MNEASQEPSEIKPNTIGGGDQAAVGEHRQPAAEPRQNLGLGILGAIAGAIVGIAVWVAVTAATGWQPDWMAIAIGVVVGLGMRVFGKGRKPDFGTAAVVVALVAVFLGNLLMICILAAQKSSAGLMQVLSDLPLDGIQMVTDGFQWHDPVFYVIALIASYFLAYRQTA